MTEPGIYRTIEGSSEGVFRDKGSRFLAFAFNVSSPDDAMEIVAGIRKEFHDARHHCYAYMTGAGRTIWRTNDDGEPSGTAGRPILGQINSNELTDILIVVVRYFGGTLLGVSGLINAYRSAAADALANSRIVTRQVMKEMTVRFPWTSMNDVMKILKETEQVKQKEHLFESDCTIRLAVPVSIADRIAEKLAHLPAVAVEDAE